jgi:hypothetical protein
MDLLLIVVVGSIIAALVVLVILFSLKGNLGTYREPPEVLLPALSWGIQSRGFSCSEKKPGVLSVRKDSLVRVSIHFRPVDGATKVLYEADATELGWAVVFILIFAPYIGWASIVVALYIHFSGRSFSRGFIRRLIPPRPEKPRPEEDRIRENLLQAILEGERFVAETREQERLAIWTIEAVAGLGALVVWSLLFFVPHLYWGFGFTDSLILATSFALLILAPGLHFSTKKGRGRLKELDGWGSLLAMRREEELTGRRAGEETTFDLVMRVSQMSRIWLQRLKKLKLWNHPVAGSEIFLWFWGGIAFLALGILGPELPWLLALFLIVLGALFILAGLYRAINWRRTVLSEFERDKRLWEERMSELKESMENYLRDL